MHGIWANDKANALRARPRRPPAGQYGRAL